MSRNENERNHVAQSHAMIESTTGDHVGQGDAEAGKDYKFSFEPNGLSDNVYIYRLVTPEGDEINKKLILIK